MTPVLRFIISVKEIAGSISDIKMAPSTIISGHLTIANELWSPQPHGGGNSILVLTGEELPGFSKVRQAACDQGGKWSQVSLWPTYLIHPYFRMKTPSIAQNCNSFPDPSVISFSAALYSLKHSFFPCCFQISSCWFGTFKEKRLIASYPVPVSSSPLVSSW